MLLAGIAFALVKLARGLTSFEEVDVSTDVVSELRLRVRFGVTSKH